MSSARGFTLLELIIVFSVMFVVTGITTSSYRSFQERRELTHAGKMLIANLRLAQSRALAGVKGCGTDTLVGWYVTFQTAGPTNSYTINSRCGLSSGSITLGSSPRTFNLPQGMSLSISPNNTDILFQPINKDALFIQNAATQNLVPLPPLLYDTASITLTSTKAPSERFYVVVGKNGDIAEAKTGPTITPITPTPTSPPPTPTTAPTPALIAHWKMDEASWNGTANEVVDSSGNGKNGTALGGVTTTLGILGNAGNFTGTGGRYVSIPDSNSWAFSGDFTLSLWANFTSTSNPIWGEAAFLGHDEGGGFTNKWIFGYDSGGRRTAFHINDPSGVDSYVYGNNWIASTGTWYHLALTRSGNTYTFYRNGSPDGSSVNSYTIPNPNSTLRIGYAEGSNTFNGIIDDVRIYNYALTAAEIAALFTPPPPSCPTSGLVSHWKMDEASGSTSATDSTGSNIGTYTNGATTVVGKFSNAGSFDGANDYVSVPSSPTLNLSQVTVSLWTNQIGTIDNSTQDTQAGEPSSFMLNISYGVPRFTITSNSSGSQYGQAMPTANSSNWLQTNTWYHLVGTFDGTTIKIYQDGVLKNSNAWNFPIYPMVTSFYIGGSPWGYSNGRIDDVRIYNRVLSQTEISNLYNSGSGCVP